MLNVFFGVLEKRIRQKIFEEHWIFLSKAKYFFQCPEKNMYVVSNRSGRAPQKH